MLDIIELSSKSQSDLVAIAKELKVHRPESLDKDALVYAILDQQAIVSNEDPKKRQPRKKKKAESLKWIKEFGAIEGYKVLLCHHPEYYDRYDVGKYCDLVLAGHVHGGHVRLFGRGLFSSGQGFLPKYSKGLYDGKMIVSAGLAATGTILPRIFNEQEILKVRI